MGSHPFIINCDDYLQRILMRYSPQPQRNSTFIFPTLPKKCCTSQSTGFLMLIKPLNSTYCQNNTMQPDKSPSSLSCVIVAVCRLWRARVYGKANINTSKTPDNVPSHIAPHTIMYMSYRFQ